MWIGIWINDLTSRTALGRAWRTVIFVLASAFSALCSSSPLLLACRAGFGIIMVAWFGNYGMNAALHDSRLSVTTFVVNATGWLLAIARKPAGREVASGDSP